MNKKSVAIIGAGVTGLASVKECLVHGLVPKCFEKNHDIGGLWLVQEPQNGKYEGRIYKGMIQNVFKHNFCYSDFPQPEDAPLLLPASSVTPYLKSYCDKFSLNSYIHCNVEVVNICKAGDYNETGNWAVTVKESNSDSPPQTEIFNAVQICTGRFTIPRIPGFASESPFQGPLLHTSQVWDPSDYTNKTVVIIGAGVSGVDMASALAPFAKQINIICSNGTWLIPTFLKDGTPYEDFLFSRKLVTNPNFDDVRRQVADKIGERWNLGHLGFGPRGPLAAPGIAYAVSDDIALWVQCGKVKAFIDNVQSLESTSVLLKSGTKLMADAVIFATGYNMNFPFLHDEEIVKENSLDRDWWMNIYPIHQAHSTLFFHMCFFHWGSATFMAEVQARASCGILAGALILPSMEEMKNEIQATKDGHKAVFSKFPGIVNGVQHCLELSKFIGCHPDLWQIEKRDPKLAEEMRDGPVFPAHFRLLGPHSDWDAACRMLEERKQNRYKFCSNPWPNKGL